ncbi:MAG: tetratricopeptide repeat protein [Psychroserpens sp.]|nr:tetratricopeptide repeat protein [Psychroserpens sp.]
MNRKSLLTLGFLTSSLVCFSQVVEKDVVKTDKANNIISSVETGMYDGTKSEDAEKYYGLAVDYAREKDTKNAVKYYLKAVKADPGFEEAYDNLGRVYRTIGEYENAIECYKKSIEIYPSGEMAHQNLAVVYGIQQRYDEALVQYEIMQEISPKNPESFFGASNIYMQQKEYNKALDNAEKALELYKASNSHYIGDAYYLIGLIHYYSDNHEEAKKHLQLAKDKGVKLSPNIDNEFFGKEVSTEKTYKLEKPEDYAQYEDEIVAMVNWLSNTPVSEMPDTRKEINAFLLSWLTGSPDITIEISEKIVSYTDCGECLFLFMGGWAKYSIESDDNNAFNANLAGTKTAIKFYRKNKKELGKNKAIEKLIKLQDNNELESFIRSNL